MAPLKTAVASWAPLLNIIIIIIIIIIISKECRYNYKLRHYIDFQTVIIYLYLSILKLWSCQPGCCLQN